MRGKETLSLPHAQAEQSVRSDVPVTGGKAGGQHPQRSGGKGAAEGGPGAHGAPAARGEETQQGHQAAEGERSRLGAASLRLPLGSLQKWQVRFRGIQVAQNMFTDAKEDGRRALASDRPRFKS